MASRLTRLRQKNHRHSDENVDRWMVSYADFITLLFAFFVVMYAISSVNEGKYETLSTTLRNNFGNVIGNNLEDASATALLIDASTPVGESVLPIGDKPRPANAEPQPEPDDMTPEPIRIDTLIPVAHELQAMFGSEIAEGNVDLRRTARGLELEINSQLLFDSGSSDLNNEYQSLLVRIAEVLKHRSNAVDVEGFTDNLPIYNERYPSNWELSAARAAAVIRLLVDNDMAPQRLAAVGYGPYRPVAGNDTAVGRAKNRRVVLVIREANRNRLADAGT